MNSPASEHGAEFRRGWHVLLACFCGVAGGIASISFYTSGVFIVPLEQEFGWSRTTISAQGLFGVLILVFGSPFLGRLIDKIGVRGVAVVSLTAYAMSIFAASYLVVSLASFYVAAILTALVALGSSPLTFTRVITGWFDSARGLALGISLMGTGLVAALAPPMLTAYVDEFGWRAGYRALSIFVFAMAVMVWIFIKEDPEHEQTDMKKIIASKDKIGLVQLIKSRVFIQLAGIFFMVAVAVSGVIVHFIPMLVSLEIDAAAAGNIAAVLGVSVMVGRLVAGFLIDRFHAPNVASVLFGMSSLGLLMFLLGGANYSILAAVAIGISMGAEVDLIGYLVSRYFGLSMYGSIYGILYAVFLVGASLSPLLLGYLFDVNGGYTESLILATALLTTASMLCLSLEGFPKSHD